MSTKLRRPEIDEAGWISMCDLLLLLFAVAILVAVVAIAAERASRESATSGEQLVGALEDENARLRNEVGDWTITAQTVQTERDRYKGVLESFGEDAEEIAARLKLVEEQAAETRELRERDALATLLVEQLRRTADEALAAAAASDSERAEARKFEVEQADRIAELERTIANLGDALAQERLTSGGSQSALADERAERLAAESKVSELSAAIESSASVKQELLGIPGDLTNVVFVVDRSQSMERGGRWEDARRTIGGWIRHLPVERCALVLFDSTVSIIPSSLDDGREVELDSRVLPTVDDKLREEMMTQLDAMDPRGATQTLKGLRRAMQFKDLSAIVLFTDGAPDPAGGTRTIGDPREQVFALIDAWKESHPAARIHTVGIGDYFNASMRDFLLGVAKRSGGAFIGR